MILQHSSCQVFSQVETLHFMSSLVFVTTLNHDIMPFIGSQSRNLRKTKTGKCFIKPSSYKLLHQTPCNSLHKNGLKNIYTKFIMLVFPEAHTIKRSIKWTLFLSGVAEKNS